MKVIPSLLAAVLAAASHLALATGVQIKQEIAFADGATSQKVQDECGLQRDIPKFIAAYAKDGVTLVENFDTAGRRLELTITNAYAPGGGAWSGAKWVEVSGTLYQGDQQVGSFISSRYSTGGMFGGFKGTCSIVGRCGKVIGKDIAAWLKNPSENAKLGDSK